MNTYIKTLYISDLDGTLLNEEKQVSDFSKEQLNKLMDKGLNFSIASARTKASAVKILSGLKINTPIILMNGAVVYDLVNNKFLKIEAIPIDTVTQIVKVLKNDNVHGFMYAITNEDQITYYEGLHTQAMIDFHDERVTKYYKTFMQVASFEEKISDGNIVYFTIIDQYERLTEVLTELKSISNIDAILYKDVYSENLWFLEIYSEKASKYNAVMYLRKYCNYDKVVCFGDNFNDLPLFRASDECYAVENAVDELKQKATGIIGANICDGVVKFLLK